MDHFGELKKQLHQKLLIAVLGTSLFLVILAIILIGVIKLPLIITVPILLLLAAVSSLWLSRLVVNQATAPLFDIWRGFLHVTPGHSETTAPNLETIKVGKELVSAMLTYIYQLVGQGGQPTTEKINPLNSMASTIVNHLPLPLIVFNKDQKVVLTSPMAIDYCSPDKQILVGKQLYDAIDLEFSTEPTLDKWIEDCKQNKINATASWERVRLRRPDNQVKLCDLLTYYNRDNTDGSEFILVIVDRTVEYSKTDDDINFIALAVHELRTPLTILRGYIEVFDDELRGKLDPEMAEYLSRMIVSAQQLNAFFANILNVVRIDQNQLSLHMAESNWLDVLQPTCQELDLNAKVHKRHLRVDIAPDLPPVAVDKFAIIEVINNLVGNAIKYSREGETITIRAKLDKDGNVETTIQDYGPGIPTAVIPHLFDKFYRSHRSSGKISGTGFGLYISKAIINSHGGEIWVQSKEGEGSIFGFTLLPASKLAEELKAGNNKGVVRQAHGWIKNHSLYRR
ncbi:MAG TPA: HAMP domain-containing sensor histidine kinase [Candidatus Saccharimonadales bacterium]|nr:HAMP domain-containing sensor histidine kinase [Candidatus Saccharimonadales bacterium]